MEHYYQSQKFVGTQDAGIISLIRSAKTPEEAAKLGRDSFARTISEAKPLALGDRTLNIRADWEDVKPQIMAEAVLTKVLTHLDIQAILLSTGDCPIVEDSPTDYYWGCGLDKTGQNQLGKILMSVRERIRLGLNNNDSV